MLETAVNTFPVPAVDAVIAGAEGRFASVIPLILPSAIAIPVIYFPAVTAVEESRPVIALLT